MRRVIAILAILGMLTGLAARAEVMELAYYDAADKPWESAVEVVFDAGDTWKFYIDPPPPEMTIVGSHLGLRAKVFRDPSSGELVAIPAYVWHLRNMLNEVEAYADNLNLVQTSYGPSSRFPIYIRGSVSPSTGQLPVRSATGQFEEGAPGGVSVMGGFMNLDPGMNAESMAYTSGHEYFHFLQHNLWSITRYPLVSNLESKWGRAHMMSVEGTADFFSDQPIRIDRSGRMGTLIQATTRDDLNVYFDERKGMLRFPQRGLMDATIPPHYTVFFWKALAEDGGGASATNQLDVIKRFWDGFSSRNVRGTSQFMEEVGSVAGGPGRRLERFRAFYTRYLRKVLVQSGNGGFFDDAFNGRTHMVDGQDFTNANYAGKPYGVLDQGHYTDGKTPAVQAEVADSIDAIRERLAQIETYRAHNVDKAPEASTRVRQLGWLPLVIVPPGKGTPNELTENTTLFFIVRGDVDRDDAWVATAMTKFGGADYAARSGDVVMSPIDGFGMSARQTVYGRPAGYAQIDAFAGRYDSLWLAVGNVDLQDEARAFTYSFAMTPAFQTSYTPNQQASRTSKVTKSDPARALDQVFHPGDKLTIEVDLTDSVHDGADTNIPLAKRTLEFAFLAPGSREPLTLNDLRINCVDTTKHLYTATFTIPEDLEVMGGYTGKWSVRSRLKLGSKDLNEDSSLFLVVHQKRPEVDNVIVRGEDGIVYNRRAGMLRPLGPGPATVEVYFRDKMDQAKAAEVLMDGQPLAGEWKGATWWQASITIPEPSAAEWQTLKGFRALSIQATGEEGRRIDTDAATPVEEPDETAVFFVGSVPPRVTEFSAMVGGEDVYKAVWDGWDTNAAATDVHKQSLRIDQTNDLDRTLDLQVVKDLPGEGAYLHIALRTSEVFEIPPTMTVEGVAVPLEAVGSGTYFNGKVLIEDLAAAIRTGRSLSVVLSGTDRFGMKLDGNPGTTPLLNPKTPQRPWSYYEDRRGGTDTGEGGEDIWHELGSAPDLSLVIVLDASGSMGDHNKIENAKAGINALLDVLPPRVELGLVIFSGCDNIQVTGFSRDIGALRAKVNGTTAGGATPLAAAADRARQLFLEAAHPHSREWKCRIFSDGEESCDGDVALNITQLEQTVAYRERPPEPNQASTPNDGSDDGSDDAGEEFENVPAEPARWVTYRVRVRDGGLHLDTVYLERISFLERELPNGTLILSMSVTSYPVSYIGDPADGRVAWSVNSRGSTTNEVVTERQGRAAVQALRDKAKGLAAQGKTQAQCRGEIETIINANITR